MDSLKNNSIETLSFDPDLDSVSYAFDFPYSGFNSPCPFNPNSNYSFNYPISGYSGIDPISGEIKFLPERIGNFVLCVRIESWRCGQRISEVYRDMSIQVLPTPLNFPTNATKPYLRAPSPDSAGNPYSSWKKDCKVGDTISIRLKAKNLNTQSQNISLYVKGNIFSKNFSSGGPCPSKILNCASLSSPIASGTNPTLLRQRDLELGYGFKEKDSVEAIIHWVIDSTLFAPFSCTRSNRFFIYISAYDDQCPINTRRNEYIELTVHNRRPYLGKPELNKIEVNHALNPVLSWTMNFDSNTVNAFDTTAQQSLQRRVNSLHAYLLHRVINDSILYVDTIYNSANFNYTDTSTFIDSTTYSYRYYLKSLSGAPLKKSVKSNSIKAIALQLSLNWNRGSHDLKWSKVNKPQILKNFHIYKEDPVNNPGKWILIDSTNLSTYSVRVSPNNIVDPVNYLVEYKDYSQLSRSAALGLTLTSKNQLRASNNIIIYPTYSSSNFKVECHKTPNLLYTMEVFDAVGKLVDIKELEGSCDFGTTYSKGLFFIRITNGDYSNFYKIVKY